MERQLPDGPSGLESHLGYWMRAVSNHVSRAFARRVEGRGATVAEWALMRVIYDAAPVAPSRLAERLGMTRGAITKLADRLIAKGLVERRADGNDGRAQTLRLTAKGTRLVPELAELADENDRASFAHLPAGDRRTLMRILKASAARLGLDTVPVD